MTQRSIDSFHDAQSVRAIVKTTLQDQDRQRGLHRGRWLPGKLKEKGLQEGAVLDWWDGWRRLLPRFVEHKGRQRSHIRTHSVALRNKPWRVGAPEPCYLEG